MTLDQLRGLRGAADAERSFAAARAAGDGTPGWVSGRAAAAGYACDAQLVPVVTGHLDPAALDAVTAWWLAGFRRPGGRCGRCTCPPGPVPGTGRVPGTGPAPGGGPPPLSPQTMRRVQDTLLARAAGLLSGLAGLAAFLRTGLLAAQFPAAASVSLPLDTGTSTSTVPPHLRQAVILRDRHCAFPGCAQRPAACQARHLTPRARGGVTAARSPAAPALIHGQFPEPPAMAPAGLRRVTSPGRRHQRAGPSEKRWPERRTSGRHSSYNAAGNAAYDQRARLVPAGPPSMASVR